MPSITTLWRCSMDSKPYKKRKNYRGKKRNEEKIMLQIKENPLGQLHNEGKNAYRAFLLWSMQCIAKRRINPISKAMELAYPTVRAYSQTWYWDKRGEKEPLADQKAQALYRQLFFDEFGMKEITMIEKNILAPVSVVGNTPRNIIESVNDTIAKTQRPKSDTFTKEVKRKHLMLIDAAIGYIAAGIKSGDVRRSLRDLPLLLQLRNEMTGSSKKGKGGSLVVESIRVRDAKENNGDIVEALHEDAVELAAILEALKSKGKSKLTPEDMGELNEQHS